MTVNVKSYLLKSLLTGNANFGRHSINSYNAYTPCRLSPGQLNLLSSTGQEISSGQRAVKLCGW